MKISPINNIRISRNNNLKNSKFYHSKPQNQNDCFVKSNNISFCAGKITQKFDALSKEMSNYVLHAPQIEEEKIDRIIKNYSPTTSFAQFDSSKAKSSPAKNTKSRISMPRDMKVCNKYIIVTESPKTIYANIPETLNKKERLIFNSEILRQCTYALQEESNDRESMKDFIRKHINSRKNFSSAASTLDRLPQFFSIIDNSILDTLTQGNINPGALPKEISSNLSFDSICKQVYKMSAHDVCALTLSQSMMLSDTEDTALALEYAIYRAKNEKEAYGNALSVYKKIQDISTKTDMDLRLEAYESIIESAKSFKASKRVF